MTYSASALRYYLVQGPVSLEGLKILREERREWQGYDLSMRALGASHAVSLEKGPHRVTEILSCAAAAAECSALAEVSAATSFEFSAVILDLRYAFRLEHFRLQGGDGLTGDFDSDHWIEVAYPAHADAATPLTCIGWRRSSGALELETLHTYPEDGCGVRTTSVFELRLDPPD